MDRTRGDFHLQGMLFRILLHLLQMLVVAVLGQPCDHITIRPVDLKSVRVLVVDVVLKSYISMR